MRIPDGTAVAPDPPDGHQRNGRRNRVFRRWPTPESCSQRRCTTEAACFLLMLLQREPRRADPTGGGVVGFSLKLR